MNTRSRSSRVAFTLIELLAVVAIAGLLWAILLPVLSSARKQALQSACASNLCQIGQAMTLYASDNNQQLPPMSGANGYWTAYLVPYSSQIENKSKTIFVCPANAVPIKVASDYASGGRTYAASRLILGPTTPSTGVPPLRLTQIPRPASVILVADSNQVSGNNGNSAFDINQSPFSGSQTMPAGHQASDPMNITFPNADAAPAGAIRFRHIGQRANVLMVDGHVETLGASQLTYGNVYPLGQ